jgi:hypothetical protein
MYYAFIQDEKIKGVGQCRCLTCENIEISQEVFENIRLYSYQNGEIVYTGESIPTNEEQKHAREVAYTTEVDPITSHIQRLRDEEQTEEIVQKINELIIERKQKVLEIQEKYPYNE